MCPPTVLQHRTTMAQTAAANQEEKIPPDPTKLLYPKEHWLSTAHSVDSFLSRQLQSDSGFDEGWCS